MGYSFDDVIYDNVYFSLLRNKNFFNMVIWLLINYVFMY